jgi:hypothetical protein
VLVRFVSLVACRLFALVLLLARDDRSKELKLLVLRHELSILRRQARRPRPPIAIGCYSRRLVRSCLVVVVCVPCHA